MRNYKFLRNVALSTAVLNLLCLNSAFAGVNGITVGENINVRAKSSIEGQILGKLSNNTKISITGISDDWYEIDFDGTLAYVTSEYVKITETLGIVNGSGINVRKQPSTESEIIGKLNLEDKVTVKATDGEFLLINYKGSNAYVHSSYVNAEMLEKIDSNTSQNKQEDSVYVLINAKDGVNLRSEPTTNSEILTVFDYKSAYDVLEVNDEWIKVKSDNGTSGYVNANYVSIERGVKPSNSISSSSQRGQDIISYAKQFLGTPYVWAGTNLNRGVDCSGFVYSVMKNFGISLNRSSRSMASNGTKISKSELQTGDLVFFDTSGSNNGQISHVGIYMGNGQFIHSSSSKRTWGVTISSLSESYYTRTYVTARRVL